MTRPTAVTDANTIIGLSKGRVFELLAPLFAAVYVPSQVVDEIVTKGKGRPGALELAHALGSWIVENAVDPSSLQQFAPSLSEADRAVLAVMQSTDADYIVTDDRDLQREASRCHLACLRVAEVIVLMKSQGLLPEVRSVLDQMIQAKFGIRSDVYEQVLRVAGEWTGR
jgi:predicted nucleic acid-binding protein